MTIITHHTLCIGVYGYCSGYALYISAAYKYLLREGLVLNCYTLSEEDETGEQACKVICCERILIGMKYGAIFVTFTVTIPHKQAKDRKVKYHNQSC